MSSPAPNDLKPGAGVRYRFPVLVALICIAAVLIVRQWIWSPGQGSSPEVHSEKLSPSKDVALTVQTLQQALADAGIRVEVAEKREGGTLRWFVYGAPGRAVLDLHLQVHSILDTLGLSVIQAVSQPASGQVALDLGIKNNVFLSLQLIPVETERIVTGRIAIIIDDFGARWDDLTRGFVKLGEPLTVSVIPSMKNARTAASELAAAGCEVILHMPMEPFDPKYRNEPLLLKMEASGAEIRRLMDQALAAVPFAVGVNNHMGSKATSHRETMMHFMEEVQRRQLYFVDSRTIATTVAFEMARAYKVRSAERQVFIDPQDEPAVIRNQMMELAAKARQRGEAVGIGHCRRHTLNVLQEMLPYLKSQGYEFVFVSQVVK